MRVPQPSILHMPTTVPDFEQHQPPSPVHVPCVSEPAYQCANNYASGDETNLSQAGGPHAHPDGVGTGPRTPLSYPRPRMPRPSERKGPGRALASACHAIPRPGRGPWARPPARPEGEGFASLLASARHARTHAKGACPRTPARSERGRTRRPDKRGGPKGRGELPERSEGEARRAESGLSPLIYPVRVEG